MRTKQVELVDGTPIDLLLMRELHWTERQVAETSNRTVMELLALFRLENEYKARAAKRAAERG